MSNLIFNSMSRNKVLEKAKVSIPSGRNPFDLSQERSQTSLCGEIDVVYCHPMVAGTKGTINRENFTRTADVVSPAFHRVTEHFDFFIVPIHSMWRQWENWKLDLSEMKDTYSVMWNVSNDTPILTLPSNSPRMDYVGLADHLAYASTVGNRGARVGNDCLKLLDELRLSPEIQTLDDTSKVMSLFMPAAYQKVYFEHYRKKTYEANNPYAYNFDWLYDLNRSGLLLNNNLQQKDMAVIKELFKRRRVNYRNDAFQNVYPSLNYVSNVGGQSNGMGFAVPSTIGQMLVGRGQYSGSNGSVVAYGSLISTNTSNAASGGVTNSGNLTQVYSAGISVQAIRAAFALDRLMRAAAYAPRTIRDQYKALYGVDGVDDPDMNSERIGSFQNNVVFQEVTCTTIGSYGTLGDLGAKGLGGDKQSKPINFYCKYDSIVIGVHYFLPRARYDNFGIHPWNVKIAREDFYIKAFENLGLRPFYAYNLDGRLTVQLGWTVPNSEYKILPDINLGAFKSEFLEFWDDETDDYVMKTGQTNELSTFVPHTSLPVAGASLGSITAEYFKVAPEDLDNVFRVSVPNDHRISYYQFYCDMRIIVAVTAPMSIHGQPV